MSQETSDRARSNGESRRAKDKASRPKSSDDVRSKVLESALDELMGMTGEELLESLGREPETPSHKLHGRTAPGDSISDYASDEESAVTLSSGDGEVDVTAEPHVSGGPDASAPEELDDRVKEDPITLALLQNRVVGPDLVSQALRNWDGSGQLWRVVAATEGVDSDRIFAAVAKGAGYPSYTYLDAAPTRELVDELEGHLSLEKLTLLLDRGLLPVDLDPSSDESSYRLMIVTHDPSDPAVQAFLKKAEISGVCLYAPRAQVHERIEIVRGWIDSPFGMDFREEEFNEPYDMIDEHAEVEQLGNGHGSSSFDEGDDPGEASFRGDGMSHSQPEPIEISDFDAVTPVAQVEEPAQEVRTIQTFDESEELPAMLAPASRDRVIRSLLQKRVVTDKQVAQAIAEWQKAGGKDALWRSVAALKGVRREAIYEEAARVYAFKQEEIVPGRPDVDFIVLTMDTVAEDQREELLDLLLLPFEHVVDYDTGAGRMVFVTPDPTSPEVNRLLHEIDLGRFELRYAPESAISQLLDEVFPRKNEYLERMSDEDATAFDLGTSYEEAADIVDEEALDAEINRSKLINLFEATLVEATRLGASDIHILPNPKRQIEIHFRLDGRLKKWHTEEGVSPEAFISVVKDNSVNVDRFERDAAQDGFIQRRIDDTLIRFRVSILPIASANQEIRAESIVIRILDDRKVLTELKQLGMLDTAMARFDQAIRQPHGMVILTGPTGSGKSTTLVAALHQVVSSEVNVLTVEDPVEYIINGVRQIKLGHKLNLEQALRSILRHDPDIVMVGEMRDRHTAELAIKLANTGHLTFSTLHTNDAPAAVSRLYKMGVEPFLIAYAINLVVAQRLIRTVCPTCKTVNKKPDEVLMRSLGWTDEEIKNTTVYQANPGSGCKTCNGMGYKGRRAVCETLYFTDKVRALIAESGAEIDEEAIRKAGIADGMLTLRESAKRLVDMGETSVEEMLRVTGAE